ncbi:MAG: MauE/DoxX family redox-associated membrane protein [Gammaproteobacteria bacterium]|jgi:hypothetical protein
MIDPVLVLVLSWCLGLLFLAAAADKVIDWRAFRSTLEEYQLVPRWGLVPVGVMVAVLEAISGVGLLFSASRVVAAFMGAGLLVCYGLGIWINLLRGRVHIDCGCLGGRESALSHWLVLRNVMLAIAALLCALPTVERSLSWVDVLSITGGVVSLAVLYLGLNLLLSYHLEQSAWGLIDE